MNQSVSQKENIKDLELSKDGVLKCIEACVLKLIRTIVHQGTLPVLNLQRRSTWRDIIFDGDVCQEAKSSNSKREIKFNACSAKKFTAMLKVLEITYCMVQKNRFCTKRDIFYQHPNLYKTQSGMDHVIEDVALMLQVPRWEMHILATCKGLVAGNLQIKDEQGNITNCQKTTIGVQIAAHSKDMQNLSTSAEFVLIVEKDATFQNLMTSKFCNLMKNCILITGKGFPDIGTRLLLQQLWLQYKLPMFALVDADPHGLEIMAVYKHGSREKARLSHCLAVPIIQWLGIWPEDIERYSIPEKSLIPLTAGDVKKAHALKKRPYFKDDPYILGQIDKMLESGKKAEIQCLDDINSVYLCNVYLPSRIELLLPSKQESTFVA